MPQKPTLLGAAYKAISACEDFEFTHSTVNHSENFVDPETGESIQNIERTWREVKSAIPESRRMEKHFEGYSAEYLFKRAYLSGKSRICGIFCAIAELYNPYNNPRINTPDSQQIAEFELLDADKK